MLFGRKDVEDALRRLDRLTQEEARMAAAESLMITRGIDDTVKGVDEKLDSVDESVQSIGIKVEGIDDKVVIVDSKIEGVDDRVMRVDHKVGSVIEGELYRMGTPLNLSSAFPG
jgi:archaellum component FlaC